MIYLQLFYEFFKTGMFAVGGGMATLPFLSAMAEKTGWFAQGMLADLIAVCEATAAGIPGAIVATLGLITPSVIIILIIARFLKAFRDNKHVDGAFYGLRPCSVGLIAAAGMSVVKLSLLDEAAFQAAGDWLAYFRWDCILLAAALLVCTRWVPKVKDLHPIWFILGSAVIGVVFRFGGA